MVQLASTCIWMYVTYQCAYANCTVRLSFVLEELYKHISYMYSVVQVVIAYRMRYTMIGQRISMLVRYWSKPVQ